MYIKNEFLTGIFVYSYERRKMTNFFKVSHEHERWLKFYQLITSINYELKDVFPVILSNYGDCKCGSDNINGHTIWEFDDETGDSWGIGDEWFCDNCGNIVD